MGKIKPVLAFLAGRGWSCIGGPEWRELTAAFPGIAAASLVKAGIAIEQPFRGVEQHTFEQLETSLRELAGVYEGRPELRALTRRQVIAAKDRARWASRNRRADEAARRRKAEMLEWMLVWLDDPAMFAAWVALRRARMSQELAAGVLSGEHGENENNSGEGGQLMPAIPDVSGENREKCDVCGGSGDCVECKGTGNGGQCFNCAGTGNCPQCQGTGLRKKKA